MFQIGTLKGESPGPEREEWGVEWRQWKEKEMSRSFVQNGGTSFLYHGAKSFWNYLT